MEHKETVHIFTAAYICFYCMMQFKTSTEHNDEVQLIHSTVYIGEILLSKNTTSKGRSLEFQK